MSPKSEAATRTSAARDRILATAARVFYAEGIHGVGIDRVITEAPVTRATFYRHFAGKEALVVAYLQLSDQAIRSQIDRVAAVAPADVLRGIAAGIGESLCGPGFRGCAFINAAAEYPDPQDPVHRAVLEHRSWFRTTVRDTLAAAGHPLSDQAADHFVMLRDGAMVAGYLSDPEAARRTLARGTEGILGTIPA